MLLSVIIPVYNVEAYVGKTLESVFHTTASSDDFEVIVVNDGTKDGSMKVVRQFADRPNLTILEQENQGLSAARMKGCSVAGGEYLWFVDSDDYLVEDGVGKVLALLRSHSDAEVLMFPLLRKNGEEVHLDYQIEGERRMDGKDIVKDPKLPEWNVARYVLKRSMMENPWVFFPKGLIHEDDYFGAVMLWLANDVRVMPDPVYFHEIDRPGSIMNTLTRRSLRDMVSIHRIWMPFMQEVVDPSEWTWFRTYAFKKLMYCWDSFPRRRFSREGLYLWKAWKEVHPDSTWKTRVKGLLSFMMPETGESRFSFGDGIRQMRVRRNYAGCLRRLKRKVKEGLACRVIFYTNEPQKWSYESLYREMEANPRFEPVIVVVPRYAVHAGKDHTRMTLEEQYAFYKERGYHVEYGYENGRYLDVKALKPDIFFYLQLAEVPGIDDPEIVSRYALTCYCPYSFPLTDYRKEYLPQFHRLLFRYYVVHEWTRERFEGYAKGNSRNCVVVGYPKLDVYFKGIPEDADKYWKEPSKVRIIYAPHHSVGDGRDIFRFSTFPDNHQVLLDLAEETRDRTTWIFKPHPMLRQAVIHAGIMTKEELDAYFRAWSEVGQVYDQGDYFDIFKSSDLMITDCASFLAEYLPSGHPLIRLVNSQSCELDKLGLRLSDCYYNVHDETELKQAFEELVVRRNDYLAPHRNEIAATLIDQGEKAADKVLRDLEDSIK